MIKHQTRIKTLLLLFTLLFPCTVLSVCSDDNNFAWDPGPDEHDLRCENLNYMQDKNEVCNKEVQGLNREQYPNKVKVRNMCRMACGNCEFECQDDCTDDTRFRWNKNRSCHWLKATNNPQRKQQRLLEHCTTAQTDLYKQELLIVNELCPSVCGNCC